MKTLDRQKLDVANKTRSNIFGWRGQFTPEFVAYLLDAANEGTGLVVDPFCGSGTVLQECAARNRAAHGFEINPAAYAMSRFFTLFFVLEKSGKFWTLTKAHDFTVLNKN
jgi:tRNA G10  N-methylase Trm11